MSVKTKIKKGPNLKKQERLHLIEWLHIITCEPRELWEQLSDESLNKAFEKNVAEHGKEII